MFRHVSVLAVTMGWIIGLGAFVAGGGIQSEIIDRDNHSTKLSCVLQKLEGEVTSSGLTVISMASDFPDRLSVRAMGIGRGDEMGALPERGVVETSVNMARWIRLGVIEEYTASRDGVRQDFVVQDCPAGDGALRVELEVTGARVEPALDGAFLLMEGSKRRLAYNSLLVIDSQGRELPARMEVALSSRITLVVDDAAAVYPIRIDPTFSDDNWVSMGGVPGVNASVNAIAVSTNSGRVYLVGEFAVVGEQMANRIACWDGGHWTNLGSGANNSVRAAAVDAMGNLYIGGVFSSVGDVNANRIAKWDVAAQAWTNLGSGMNGIVSALACDSEGALFAGGAFTTAGGQEANRIAKWDPVSEVWTHLGSGMNSTVSALAVDDTGQLYAGGSFTNAGEVGARYVAKWDSSVEAWTNLGMGMNSAVDALICDSNGNLFAGGGFTNAGGCGVNRIATWNGTGWTNLAQGVGDNRVYALTMDSTGNLYAGGTFVNAGGRRVNKVTMWNVARAAWTNMGSGIGGTVSALSADGNGNIYVGGNFTLAGDVAVASIALWDGTGWARVSDGYLNGMVRAVEFGEAGDIYVGGAFTAAGAWDERYVAKWDSISMLWTNLGMGVGGTVYALAWDDAGFLYIGGQFTNASGRGAINVAKWDSVNGSWTNLGLGVGGVNDRVDTLAWDGAGGLYVGGTFTTAGGVSGRNRIAKWDSVNGTWTNLGSGMSGAVSALICDSNGNLYAGGYFTNAGGVGANRVAKWMPETDTWTNLGTGITGDGGPYVSALELGNDGCLFAGGSFTNAGGLRAHQIAKWDGNAWTNLSAGVISTVLSLTSDKAGNLYAGGNFASAGGVPAKSIATWNPTRNAWTNLGSGVNGIVNALTCGADDMLYVGGDFPIIGGKVSCFIARAFVGVPDMSVLDVEGSIMVNDEAVSLAKGTDFGMRPAGTGWTNLFAITNGSSASLHISGVTTSGLSGFRFQISGFPSIVSPGSVSNFSIIFDAAAPGTHTAAFSIENDSTNTPFVLNLKGSAYEMSVAAGPSVGGNTLVITNGLLNDGFDITNVTVCGVQATIVDQGENWVEVTLGPGPSEGLTGDVTIQSESAGKTILEGAYTYNPAGEIGGAAYDWSRWEEVDGMPLARSSLAAGVLNGLLYAIGGTYTGAAQTNVYCYDGVNWEEVSGLPDARDQLAAGVQDGALFALGGDKGGPKTNVYRYDGVNWMEVAGLPANRVGLSAVTFSNALYAIGGMIDIFLPACTNVYKYDGTNWSEVAGLPIARYASTAAELKGFIYSIGGYTGDFFDQYYSSDVYRYNGTNWSLAAYMPEAKVDLVATTLNGFLYVFGASDTNVYRFDGESWEEVAGLPTARGLVAAATFSNSIYAIGGSNSTNVFRYPRHTAFPGVMPSSAFWTGDYTVIIIGSNLCNGGLSDVTNVTLCGVNVMSIDSTAGSTQIVVTAGIGMPGVGDVVVYSVDYGRTLKADAFTYTVSDIVVRGTNEAWIASGEAASLAKGGAFGHVAAGTAWTNVFSITNVEPVEVIVAGGTTNGSGAAAFKVIGLPSEIAAGMVSNFAVVFAPANPGTYAAALSIENDSGLSPYMINLSGEAFALSVDNGPAAGGNSLMITNGLLGDGFDITNVTVCGVQATMVDQGKNWVEVTLGPGPSEGITGDVTIQSESAGEIIFSDAYRYNPEGWINDNLDAGWTEILGLPNTLRLGQSGGGVMNGQLYALGRQQAGAFTNIYTFDGLHWTEVSHTPAPRSEQMVEVMGGRLYVMGGQLSGMWRTNVYAFDGTNWQEVAGLPRSCEGMACVSYNDRLYVAGGNESISAYTNMYRFDGTNWTEVAGLPFGREYFGMAVFDGSLFALGGMENGEMGMQTFFNTVFRFDGSSWSSVEDLPVVMAYLASESFDDGLFSVGGGEYYTAFTNVFCYDGTSWTEKPGLPAPRKHLTTWIMDGHLYAAGGVDASSNPQTNAYRHHPVSCGINPGAGVITGGYRIVISGANLGNSVDITNVTLCGVSVSSVENQSATQVVVVAGSADVSGLGDVRVYSTGFGETVKSNAFTYERMEQATLVFAPASPQTYLTTNVLSVSGGSGTGAVSYAVEDGPGQIVGDTNLAVTAGLGTITVVAAKAQDDWYLSVSVTATVAAAKANQTIIDFLPTNGSVFVETERVGLSAGASSGLPVVFATNGGPGSIESGTNLSFLGRGWARVVASQLGDDNWNPALEVTNAYRALGLFTLTIESMRGATLPSPGVYTNAEESVLTNQVSTPDTQATTQYVAGGWVMTDHEPSSGASTQYVMIVSNNATLTWLWTTNYWLDTEAGPHGSVNVGDSWQALGVTTDLTATADRYYHFANWTGDAVSSDNPLSLVMDGPKSAMATFTANYTTNHPTPEWWLADYGLTNDFEEAVTNDPDGDGVPTGNEYSADTNPTNSDSYLRLNRIEAGRIEWVGGVVAAQFLETSEDMRADDWNVVYTNEPPTDLTNTTVIVDGPGHALYRIRVVR